MQVYKSECELMRWIITRDDYQAADDRPVTLTMARVNESFILSPLMRVHQFPCISFLAYFPPPLSLSSLFSLALSLSLSPLLLLSHHLIIAAITIIMSVRKGNQELSCSRSSSLKLPSAFMRSPVSLLFLFLSLFGWSSMAFLLVCGPKVRANLCFIKSQAGIDIHKHKHIHIHTYTSTRRPTKRPVMTPFKLPQVRLNLTLRVSSFV